jgi:hypothetical protein
MTGVAITDAIIERYWQWAVTLLPSDFTARNVIKPDPGSGLAFLLDPTDQPSGSSQNTGGKLTSTQQVLIPLFIAAADIPCQFCNASIANINLTAEKNYLLGHVQSQVSITSGVGSGGVNAAKGGFLDVDVCGQPNPGPVTTVSNQYIGTSNHSLFHASSINIPGISISANCNKYVSQDTWCLGTKINFTSVGFWTVISPSDISPNHVSWSNGDTISYNTVVTAPISPVCAHPVFANGLSTTITYTVTGL